MFNAESWCGLVLKDTPVLIIKYGFKDCWKIGIKNTMKMKECHDTEIHSLGIKFTARSISIMCRYARLFSLPCELFPVPIGI
jgi:hypothetical protein